MIYRDRSQQKNTLHRFIKYTLRLSRSLHIVSLKSSIPLPAWNRHFYLQSIYMPIKNVSLFHRCSMSSIAIWSHCDEPHFIGTLIKSRYSRTCLRITPLLTYAVYVPTILFLFYTLGKMWQYLSVTWVVTS